MLEVVPSAGGALADRLEASVWRLVLDEPPPAELGAALEALLATDEVMVERMTKKGLRRFDARAAIVTARLGEPQADRPSCAILDVVLRHGTPSVRPDDVLAALRRDLWITRQRRCSAATGTGSTGSRRRHGGGPVGS